MNRSIRSFKAPSRRDYVRYTDQLERRVFALEQALKHVVKSEGSSLVEGRYTLIIPDNPELVPKPYEIMTIKHDKEQGQTALTVEIDADIKKQIDDLRAELEAQQVKETPQVILTDAEVGDAAQPQ